MSVHVISEWGTSMSVHVISEWDTSMSMHVTSEWDTGMCLAVDYKTSLIPYHRQRSWRVKDPRIRTTTYFFLNEGLIPKSHVHKTASKLTVSASWLPSRMTPLS